MIFGGTAALLMLAFGGFDQAAPARGTQIAQVRIRQQIIIRIPQGVRQVAPAGASLIQWRESRGPRCVSASTIIGATMIGQSSVDLILRDNSRVRARLERRCPALDYYYGFYLNATTDGRICADRDVIRSRVGGECGIDQFRTLKAEKRS